MINNTNIIDYTISGSENANSLAAAAAAASTTIIIANEKHLPQTRHAAVILPQNNSGFIANYTESPPPNEYATYVTTTMNMMNSSHAADNCTLHLDDVIKSQLKQQQHGGHQMQLERVKVQHLQTHTNLQNNRWNYHSFYNLNAETEKELTKSHIINNNNNNFNNNNNNNNSKNNNNNIQHESAFVKIDDMNDKNSIFISAAAEAFYNHCNNNIRFVPSRIGVNNTTTTTNTTATINNSNRKCTLVSDVFECALAIQQQQQQQQPKHRTEDQENAFRRIEDVHNYAKINPTNYSNGASSTSSINDDDDDADDVESEDDEDDDDEDALDLDNKTYEHFYTNRLIKSKTKNFEPNRMSQTTKVANKRIGAAERAVEEELEDDDIETDVNVDIESIQLRAPARSEPVECASSLGQRPNNHARRPMNAFLIFCKRHRAIVKERYKSLENRAITKILGDWWASLDANDKKCFTNLAQQNKDVFFSANPNFKWYKLPAPPCRTLATRPTNVERSVLESEQDNGNDTESFIRKARTDQVKARSDNYFKLADVAQMGELSALLSNNRNKVVHCELQQALGETTEFFNAHMPAHYQMGKTNTSNNSPPATVKHRLHSDHSFSSNSSEDDVIPKKTSRSCKGKIYQELKNSGQITIVAKKSKNNQKSNSSLLSQTEQNGDMHQSVVVVLGPEHNNSHMQPSSASSSSLVLTCQSGVGTFLDDSAPHADLTCSSRKRIVSETESLQSCDLANFDLEEKIKELPALNLELYLQRKRNTKKKKKFNTKKRNSNSISSNKSNTSIASPTATQNNSPKAATNKMQIPQSPAAQQQQQPAQVVVGSQKRKARKESITRRDVSAIENEVASLIPLNTDFTTINGGRYYFDEETEEASSSSSPKMLMTTITMSSQIAASDAFAQVSTNTIAAADRDAAAVTNLIYPHSSSSNIVDNNLNDSNNISSSTSDLLILAEVAANRTGSIN